VRPHPSYLGMRSRLNFLNQLIMWHYLCESLHCSREQAEESWEGNFSDGAPSALLRLIPFADESLSVEPTDIPRIVNSRAVPNRVARLKALGNGQVPACAARAWELLQ
jgi:hypothetical protein